LRVVPRVPGDRLESRSGAGVHPVTTADGAAAYVKLVPASLGSDALVAAHRELRFYRELAPIAPVRTPALLNHVNTDDGVGLLLAATGETLDVDKCAPHMWAALGHDLAALHGMPGPSAREWNGPDALGTAMAEPDLHTIRACWEPTLPRLDEILSGAGRLKSVMSALPPTFVHGDCHTENITHVDGSLVLCDWQSAGIHRPSTDLAFLNVRATPAGVTVPSALLDAYLAGHAEQARELRRAILAEELAILVFQWPHYAAYNSPSGIARIRARAGDLAEQWLEAPALGGRGT
jgi:Ser/Thr protein kinase RdoA (MazF antagonist)